MTQQAPDRASWNCIREIFEDNIPFHKLLRFKIEDLETGQPKLNVAMENDYIGNFVRGNLHGGVISSLLDIVGGMVAFVDVVNHRELDSTEQRITQFSKMGTIDIRVDYLRPGFGKQFFASACVLRTGKKVAVTRMELHNEQNLLIAVGTGAYSLG